MHIILNLRFYQEKTTGNAIFTQDPLADLGFNIVTCNYWYGFGTRTDVISLKVSTRFWKQWLFTVNGILVT